MTTLSEDPVQQARPGDARWFFGMLAIIRATAADTDGAYTLVEVHCPPGLEAPLHVHHAEEEGFLVLAGEVTITIGDEVIAGKAGDFVLGRRGVPHAFRVGADGARMLWVVSPGGFERLVMAASVPAERLSPPPPEVLPPADAAAIITRFGNALVG